MKVADSRRRFSRRVNRAARLGVYAAVAAASFLVARAWAGLESAGTAAKADAVSEEAAPRVAPNYALEERFLPDQVSKLVFDLAVTPHWFSESDRFWYSYQTTEGTRYYIVDPVKKLEGSSDADNRGHGRQREHGEHDEGGGCTDQGKQAF